MANKKRAIALGFFDGVHLGHRALIEATVSRARMLSVTPAVFTFDTHPLYALLGECPPLITSNAEKARLMKSISDTIEVRFLPFDKEMQNSAWEDFLDRLICEYGAVHLVCGDNYHFGYRGEGDASKLLLACAPRGISCEVVGRVCIDGVPVSSSHIREAVGCGDFAEASRFLGYPYFLSGRMEGCNFLTDAGLLHPPSGEFDAEVYGADGIFPARVRIFETGGRITAIKERKTRPGYCRIQFSM